MANQPKMGTNRTGAATQPRQTKALREASFKMKQPMTNGRAIMELRRSYANGGVGSVPPPTTLRGLGKTLVELLSGARGQVLMDRLSERLCSERSAVRLYEGLMAKHEAMGSWKGGPERRDLERLRAEELGNFHSLHKHIESMGADPTTLTPSADVAQIVLMGVPHVIADPRTDLFQSVEAMCLAEHADNAYWKSLVELTWQMGHEEMAADFQAMLANEARHLSLLTSWVTSGLATNASLRLTVGEKTEKPSGNGRRKRNTKRRPTTTTRGSRTTRQSARK